MGFGVEIANDLLAPPLGLGASRSGRGAYAARDLAVNLYYRGLGHRPDSRTGGWSAYRVNLRESEGPAPAMSWYLSRRSQRDMAKDLCPSGSSSKDDQIENDLRQLGRELKIADLPDRVHNGQGCKALKRLIAGGP
jgi:hypothetical protein